MSRDTELMKRIRAAAGYASGRGLKELERHVKFSVSTAYRRGKADRLGDGEAYEVHRATGAPMWFLEGGWENYPGATAPGSDAVPGGRNDDPGAEAREADRKLGPDKDAGGAAAEPDRGKAADV